MEIRLNKALKLMELVKKDGTVISSYSYKSVKKDNFSYEDFFEVIDKFNAYLSEQPDFDRIQDLLPYVNAFDFTKC